STRLRPSRPQTPAAQAVGVSLGALAGNLAGLARLLAIGMVLAGMLTGATCRGLQALAWWRAARRAVSIVMRHRPSILAISFWLIAGSVSLAGEPHPYLVSMAREVRLPRTDIRMELVPGSLSYFFKERVYSVDELTDGRYPLGAKNVTGPSQAGFVIRVSVGPRGNLPMARVGGLYSERRIATTYWLERIYGFETSEGSLAISVSEGQGVDQTLLSHVEREIKKAASQWKLAE